MGRKIDPLAVVGIMVCVLPLVWFIDMLVYYYRSVGARC